MRLKGFGPGDRAVFVLLGLVSSLLIIAAYWYRPGFLAVMDLKASDAMFAARRPAVPPAEVVVVAVDERSVNELGRWPWSRTRTAELIRALAPAKSVVLDMVFSEPSDARADHDLASAIEEAGNVTLGYFFRNDSTQEPPAASLRALNRSKIKYLMLSGGADAVGGQGPVVPAPLFASLETNTPAIGRSAAGFGAFNVFSRYDGIYRNANLLFAYGPSLYPSLSLEALRHYFETDVVVNLAPYGIDSIELDDMVIPVDESGSLDLNFYGASGAFKTYSAADVIMGRVEPEKFAGRLVFVGVTEKAVYDIRPTPLDALFPGVEIHATAAANVLEGRYLVHDTRVVIFDLLMVLVLPLLLALAVSFTRRTFYSLAVFAAMLVSLVVGYFVLFTFYSVIAGVVYPALSLSLGYLMCEAYRNAVVEKKSRYLKRAFSTYVSPHLVTQIIRDPESLKLGGELRDVSVLFSDIRGFTSISERLAPGELVALLNEYLTPMTGIVLEEEGMLDKYIGDAVMAIFNAPVAVRDHPARACSAALAMMERLDGLNAGWRSRGLPALDIGIGVNTGEAVVGNMGADLKFDYTGIGDTVNLASRLEGLNKLYGTHIIVSGYTRERAGAGFFFRELDLVRVKGKERPVAIYELISGPSAPAAEGAREFAARFEDALALYRKMRFTEARDAFEAILTGRPDDAAAKLYIERCTEYASVSPSADWDGVFVAKTK